MTRRIILTVLVCASVALAGCGLGPGGDGTTTTADGASPTADGTSPTADGTSPGTTQAPTTADGGDGGDGGASAQGWFDLSRPGSYQFQVSNNSSTGTMAIDVTEASDDNMTVNVSIQGGLFGQDISGSATGPVDNASDYRILGQLSTGQGAGQDFGLSIFTALMLGLVSAPEGLAEGHELRVGNTWTNTTNGTLGEGDRIEFEVTGQDEYAGVQCYTTTGTFAANGTKIIDTCLTGGDFTPYLRLNDYQNNDFLEIELTEYEQG